ncbi:MAG: hypothetical protein ACTHMG_16525 [Sphingomonas sp.]
MTMLATAIAASDVPNRAIATILFDFFTAKPLPSVHPLIRVSFHQGTDRLVMYPVTQKSKLAGIDSFMLFFPLFN